ncbi:TetR/AcrR family transcriptional regulator [Marinactinospora thermotolerans]|uniref:Transcriptional regulator, TetR family n=1 Tax=Marinactinospora thermotolerans DSM 45154 TaxID=1122192 RepID=A0A1T4KH22_9ACTN|nr:TetR/AcrR family transcriptional regulator [Marinactinospora thermotolerans]SJZ41701.1 transcriptional regulator, TetR family [Marinactinospora thermotolerans DSM 45154]
MSTSPTTTRQRILRAASELLDQGGREAVSTRAVSAAAGVQAPTLYRLFGDKNGLLDAVVGAAFGEYLAGKRALVSTGDPVEDLRRGWDLHVAFGLDRPQVYVLMYDLLYGGDPAGTAATAAREAAAQLHRIVARIADAGRLRMSVRRAAQLVHGTSSGLVLSLIATPPAERDIEILTVARESVLATITTPGEGGVGEPGDDVSARAVALRAALQRRPAGVLTDAEHGLLAEWLDRLGDARS